MPTRMAIATFFGNQYRRTNAQTGPWQTLLVMLFSKGDKHSSAETAVFFGDRHSQQTIPLLFCLFVGSSSNPFANLLGFGFRLHVEQTQQAGEVIVFGMFFGVCFCASPDLLVAQSRAIDRLDQSPRQAMGDFDSGTSIKQFNYADLVAVDARCGGGY